jgi:O-antigen/teichoic acid export membrane protein
MSQLKKGAILSYFNIFLNVAIGLLLTPFIITKLGDSEYGLYTLIGSFVAYLSLMDLGLNNTIVRFVSKYRAQKDKEREEIFLGNTIIIYCLISVILVFIGLIIYYNFNSIFENSLSSDQVSDGKIMFLILIFNLAITLPGNSFTAICNAYEQFAFPRILAIFRYIIRALMIVGILSLGGQAIELVIIDTILNFVIILLTMYYTQSKLKVKFNFTEKDFKVFKNIFSYSIWIFLLAIISKFQWNIGQVVLGIKVGTVQVAIYSVGIMLGGYYGAFSAAISGLFLPKASQMALNDNPEELTKMMVKVGRISFLPLALILSGFLLFGKNFIELWLGDLYLDSYIIASLIMVAFTIPLIQTFANSLVEAKDKVSFKVKVYSISFFFGIIAGYFLTNYYMGVGMITGVVIGWLIAQIFMNIFFLKVLKLNIFYFFKATLLSLIGPLLITNLIGILMVFYMPGDGWIGLGLKCLIFTIVYSMLIWKFGMNSYEKQLLLNQINK